MLCRDDFIRSNGEVLSLNACQAALATMSTLPWVVDGHPVIGVSGFVLLGALIGTDTLLNPLFKFTLVTDDLA